MALNPHDICACSACNACRVSPTRFRSLPPAGVNINDKHISDRAADVTLVKIKEVGDTDFLLEQVDPSASLTKTSA